MKRPHITTSTHLLAKSILLTAAATILCLAPGFGNPPPPSAITIPDVQVIRITDAGPIPLRGVNDGIMFEVLNWTDQDVYGVALVLNTGTGYTGGDGASFGTALVYSNGLPLDTFPANDANFPPADGTSDPAKTGADNFFNVVSPTSPTKIVYSTSLKQGSPIPPRDLLGAADAAAACALVPGCTDPTLPIANVERIDNGLSPDNVLDGFVVEFSGFDVDELISFNFFLLDIEGNPIGYYDGNGIVGNAFGFGILNVFKIPVGATRSHGPPIWTRATRGATRGAVIANTGTVDPPGNLRDMFVQNDIFQVEVGAAMTGDYLNIDDDTFGGMVNSTRLAVPVELQSFSVE